MREMYRNLNMFMCTTYFEKVRKTPFNLSSTTSETPEMQIFRMSRIIFRRTSNINTKQGMPFTPFSASGMTTFSRR